MTSSLSTEEREVLQALVKNAGTAGLTVSEIAERVGLSAMRVKRVLRELEAREQPLVGRDTDARGGTEIWIALNAAGDALDGATLP